MPPLFDFIKKILYNIYRNKKKESGINDKILSIFN